MSEVRTHHPASAPGRPVHALVRAWAAATPDAPAVTDGATTVSYRELLGRVATIAGGLRRLGVAGSPVAVRMHHGVHQVASSIAVLDAGGHLVWFGPQDVGGRGRAVLGEQRPAALLVAGDPGADDLARWFRDACGGRVLDVASPAPAPDATPPDDPGPDRPVYVAYTSGSSGRPKGVVQEHGSFAQFVTWMADALGLGPGSRVATWVAADHDPSLCEVFATLAAGGTVCAVPAQVRVHPERFAAWLVREGITFLQTVPSFARELVTACRALPRPPLLDRLALMGEGLPADLAEQVHRVLPGTRLVNMYGPTETIAATWAELAPPTIGTASTAPIGRAIPGREVLVVDRADRPCRPGVTGEIVVRSRYAAAGYAGAAPGGPAFRPLRGGGARCYRTGDLGRVRPDGMLEFRGRADDQVKLQGIRLEIGEIESALSRHASVAECAVVAHRDRSGLVHRLVAHVVPRPAATAAAGAWRAHLTAWFGHRLPVTFEVVPGGLPRNLARKVDRTRLPDPSHHADPGETT